MESETGPVPGQPQKSVPGQPEKPVRGRPEDAIRRRPEDAVPGPDLLLTLDRAGGPPLHEQLEQALREHIRGGRLLSGVKLPSSRQLARQLGVSRGVVVEAYSQLTAEGYLLAAQGAPTRVAPTASAERPPVPANALQSRHDCDFDPDIPDLSSFPRARWLRAVRSVLRTAPFTALGGGDARGAPELRNELMAYLSRVRGAAPEPEHTLVCGGFGHGFGVLCRALRARGIEQIAIETPGSPLHRLTAAAAGLEPIPVGVDETGIDTDQLAASGCEVAVLTPSHQYPTGTVLSPERRASLLAWAEEEDALIVEDDYDSELRYDRVAVGALQGLSPERICQIGSVSLRLAPGLRVGWMLSPSWLTGALTYELGVSAGAPSVLDQLALREFIACGDLDRHLRRMRAVYRARRAAMIAALWARLPGAVVRGISAGCFLPLSLGSDVDADAVVRRAAASGVAVRRVAPTPSSLVLGYANLPEATIQRGVAVLADAVTAARGTAALASTSGRSSRWTPT